MAAIGLPLPSDPVRPASLSKDSTSWSAAPSSNYRTNVSLVKLGKAAMSKVQRAFGLNMRCNSVNGAHNGHFSTNNIALIGNCAEERILAQNGAASLEKHAGTTAREDSDTNAAECFATIVEAVKSIKEGKFVVVVDDENRENEGDLIMAGSLVTPEAMAFSVKHSTCIVCVATKGEDLDRLQLPLMVPQRQNTESSKTAFTWTVDAEIGTTTGVSAEDRCKTIRALASPSSRPDDFAAPGHIFLLRYAAGGILKRRGHTEAALDLATLAGLPPAGVLCEVVNDEDGSMARLPYLKKFGERHDFPLISIDALVKEIPFSDTPSSPYVLQH